MEKAEKELLEHHGFDVEGTLSRFMKNEQLYRKCMKKFLDDSNMRKLKEACVQENKEEAFRAAHTMKGLVSNLGIGKLYGLLTPAVEKLRAGEFLTPQETAEIEEVYQEVYELIENM